MELNTPQDYIDLALRRKWWIIIPFVLVMIGSVGVYKKLPKIYRATTLILVQPQKIPTSYVQSTVTQSVTDRLATIRQQILSRTSLQEVITQLNLVEDTSAPLLQDKKVESMRKAIRIQVHRGGYRGASTSSFTLSYEGKDPVNAARIVNKIASLFITENLKVREEQARSTSQFLEKELEDIEERLKHKEEAVRRFREQYMGELPTQLDANLGMLERLQQRFQINNESIISSQQRKVTIESEIDQIKARKSYDPTDQGTGTQDPLLTQLNSERRRLQVLETQYTDQHPDVILAKDTIEKLEAQITERTEEVTHERQGSAPIGDPILIRLHGELQEVVGEINRLKREQVNLKNQIELYQQRVENVPKREEQLSTLLRDYDLLQQNYQSLLDKKIQAQLAENLERRQKGEQFKILDPATPPSYPFKPNKWKILRIALGLGLGLGAGLAFLREQMDRSFHRVDDVEKFLGFPVIASIPRIGTGKARSGVS